jgi:hypothetical protein
LDHITVGYVRNRDSLFPIAPGEPDISINTAFWLLPPGFWPLPTKH